MKTKNHIKRCGFLLPLWLNLNVLLCLNYYLGKHYNLYFTLKNLNQKNIFLVFDVESTRLNIFDVITSLAIANIIYLKILPIVIGIESYSQRSLN